MVSKLLQILAFASAALLVPSPGWCCPGYVGSGSTSDMPVKKEACCCCPQETGGQPAPPPAQPKPIKYCCCQPDTAKPSPPNLGNPDCCLPNPALNAKTQRPPISLTELVSPTLLNGSPPLYIFHCAWLC
ncbi:MAG: hypothetical protein ACJ8FY_08830 [Gemmataceae bacterium]